MKANQLDYLDLRQAVQEKLVEKALSLRHVSTLLNVPELTAYDILYSGQTHFHTLYRLSVMLGCEMNFDIDGEPPFEEKQVKE